MKAILFLTILLSGAASSAASRYLGQIGPFYQNKISTEVLNFRQCIDGGNELQLFVKKSGKYHMPRVKVDSIAIKYTSGTSDQFDAKDLGEVKGFEIETAANHGCLQSLSVRAEGRGFLPSGSQPEFIEVWLK